MTTPEARGIVPPCNYAVRRVGSTLGGEANAAATCPYFDRKGGGRIPSCLQKSLPREGHSILSSTGECAEEAGHPTA